MATRINFLVALLAVCAMGQVPFTEAEAVEDLRASLEVLKDPGSTQPAQHAKITEGILRVSEEHHRPSQVAVAMFASGLASAVRGKRISENHLAQLATEIVAVMRSAGVATFKFLQSVSRVETVLTSAGVNPSIAKRVSAELRAVGKEVRGPEDLPALPRTRRYR